MASASTYPQLADAPALDLQATDPTYHKILRLASYFSYLLPFLCVPFRFFPFHYSVPPNLTIHYLGNTDFGWPD